MSGGLSSGMSVGSLVAITVKGKSYSIDWSEFDRTEDTDDLLLNWADEVLNCFDSIGTRVRGNKSLQLSDKQCKESFEELAKWGSRTYRRFFDGEARQLLADRFQEMARAGLMPAPTFVWAAVPFPWEVLFELGEGDHYQNGGWEQFWGFRYSPARILDPKRNFSKWAREQSMPSNMLFCLHHRLRKAHEDEWPEIEKLVRAAGADRFCIFGREVELAELTKAEDLLGYLAERAKHNMVHFACHCRQGAGGSDALQISLMRNEPPGKDPPVVELETLHFVDVPGSFHRQPLIFLNACSSGGGDDELRKTFNLPQVFTKRGAAAVIATACPVPDTFAAAFARQFYSLFLRGEPVEENARLHSRPLPIGEALRRTRLYFLERYNNPLGLAYGLYTPAHYQLAKSPATIEEVMTGLHPPLDDAA